jgi:hypothetical protein
MMERPLAVRQSTIHEICRCIHPRTGIWRKSVLLLDCIRARNKVGLAPDGLAPHDRDVFNRRLRDRSFDSG